MNKIAVIGLSCLFPGAKNPEQYWQNLIEQKDLTSFATAEQMGVDANIFYDPAKGATDKYYCLRGGYVRDFQFDATGYAIAPETLLSLDKLYQWSLYVSKQALHDSGYLENRSVLADCGVILGNLSFPTRYSRELFAPIYQEIFNATLGELLQQESFQLPSFASSSSVSLINAAISGYPAALIAQALSLSGGHFSLDAACASSLYAVKLACDRLLSGKADLMLAGAISGADPFFINMGFSIFQAFPDDGVTRPLDQSSKGLLAAEGAGMLVLKRYDDAVRDGDRIYATISGIGLSNDGKGKFVLSPNSKGQILAFDRAYRNAGITPETIDYVECHATGTPVGDTTELNSMQTFFGESLPLMGSVKSNFGHLLTAAGIAGLIKVILSMSQETIPATIHVSEPIHPNIITNTIFWNHNHSTKRAAINAFGFGGTNAHLILEEAKDTSQSPIQNPKSKIQNRIAIVGMDALFGSCAGLEAFDRTIYEAKQHFIPLPPQRWQGAEEFSQLLKAYGLETGKAPPGAYIQAFEMDFFRFKIPPSDDDRLIPQQLLMLKVADQAIRDAGLQPGGNVAVIVAMGTELALHQYRARCDLSWQLKQSLASANRGLPPAQVEQLETIAKNSLHQPAQVNQYTSFIGNTMASRISALWDFSGASFTLSAEENSVFRALETAQLLLANGEVDAVVVGAIDLAGGLEHVLLHARMAPINQGSNTLSFDRHANGWMVGEGAGAVVLKRHETAKAGNDRIYAVIDAISNLQDNTIASFPNSPSSSTVKQTCLAAFDKAGIDATEIGYLEVCGSGIAREDAAEIEGLNLAYQSAKLSSQARLSCCIGSVKANMGHTYAASGMASLIKTALCLYHRYIPATPQWSGPKMPECWQASPFYVATRSKTWFLPTSASKRVAAINGLGLDGTYAHVILSEDMSQTERSSSYLEQRSLHLFPLAAHCHSDLRSQIEQLKQTIENDHDLATTASQTFTTFQQQTQATYTLAIVGHNKQEVLRELNSAIAGIHQAFTTGEDWKTPLGSYFTAHPLGKQGKVAFVYPGMGSSDLDVGRDIFRLFPNIYETFSTITPNVGEVLHETLLYSRSLEKPSKIDQTANLTQFLGDGVAMCQSGISLAVLYTLIIRDYFRVQPQITFGYSLGEASSMMFALGIWRDDRNLNQVLASSPMFKTELCGSCLEVNRFLNLPQTDEYPVDKLWTSYLLIAPVSTVREAIEPENFVYLTFINTPKEVVIAGDPNGCLRVIKQLNCDSFQIDFNSVLHCEITQSKYDELVNLHSIPIYSAPNIQFYSALTAAPLLLDSKTLAHNAAKLCCQTVDFPKIVNRVYDDGARIFLELGSSNNCSRWIRETLNGKEHIAMSINTKGVDDHTGIIRVLAKLISHCVSVDLSPLYQPVSQTADKVRSLIKTITLGGNRIRSEILTAENRKKFLAVNNVQPQMMKILQLQIDASQPIHQLTSPPPLLKSEDGKGASPIIWNEADLLEFAEGRVSQVFGKDYEVIDTYTRRVRLPMPPYLLVSRVTQLKGEKRGFKPSSITTEYDIPHNAWYSVDGQIPWAVAVESGQCDLLLISYLGIDFENQGHLVYRLLDCTLTFLDDLPRKGETLRYHISIHSFARNGDNLLFFFSYECFVGEKMVLKMDDGCAGFFSDQQLEQGKGIIETDRQLAQRSQTQKQEFEPLLICQKSTFDLSDLLHLTNGNIAACFGDHYDQYGLNPSLRLPPNAIRMIDRVISVDPTGGDWGLGFVVGEKAIAPDDWYFPCHFKDDPVMAGSLMAEGCGQLLQFYLLYLGLQTYTSDARFQPIPGLRQVVRCRGQVTPIAATLIYRMEVTEIGLSPNPYAKCNVDIILKDDQNNKTIVRFQDLGLQLSEKHPPKAPSIEHRQEKSMTGFAMNRLIQNHQTLNQKSALLSKEQIREFCTGSVSKCFGSEFEIYDRGIIKASRMPNTHLNLMHRVMDVRGKRHEITKHSTIVTEYDTPIDPWYYRQNASLTLPYSILMEIALQPCGFLSAYLGTTLLYRDRDLYFRNLDGKGHLLKTVDIRGKTVTNTARLLSSSTIEGVIIQSFDFQVSSDGEIFYQGEATFGHFSSEALVNQVGLDRGQMIFPGYETEKTTGIQIDLRSRENRNKFYGINKHQPNYHLANHQLDLLNQVKIVAGGGHYHQGYIYATKTVKPTDWYFKCHFFQDPVMPGSLGVEAILQAMQVYALQFDFGKHFKSPRFQSLINHQTVWKYRGQIPHIQTEMSLEVHLSKIEITPTNVILMGDASVWRENLRIYDVKDVAMCLVES